MRTLVVGDIHGKLTLFNRLLEAMNYQAGEDKLILIGDLVDRGEDSRGVVERAIALKSESPDTVVVLKGNHEAMMVSALTEPESEQAELWLYNGGVETLHSYVNSEGEFDVPEAHWQFMESLPTWHEDEYAIYVHAALPEEAGKFLHPSEVADSPELYWSRNRKFFSSYSGKTVIFGHTITGMLFGERERVWLRDSLIAVDTGAYLTGTLSGIEMPSRQVFSVSEAHEDSEDIIQGKAAGVKMKFWL
ncbi:MAG: metallophosphoesterase family protein [Acidobacteriota bacterium]|nr:metallophosphoesterase family protein [Acidobacteriota bacterium]